MGKKAIIIITIILIIIVIGVVVFISINENTNVNNNYSDNENINIDNSNNSEYITSNIEENTINVANNTDNNLKGDNATMKILFDNKEYEVQLDDNETVRDILNNMPLNLNMNRYAGHEYYSELAFTPSNNSNKTSEIKAGHIYYWDGWNAFVINFIDSDITPYQVVHIGEIMDKSIIDVLNSATDNIGVEVTE